MDLSRVKDRERLKPKAKAVPHWQRLSPGRYLGYCPSNSSGDGTWIARAYDEQSGNYRRKSLGSLPHVRSNERFALAKKATEEFALEIEGEGLGDRGLETVEDACRSYAADKPEAAARFERHVYAHSLGRVKLGNLRRRNLVEWRKWLDEKPAIIAKHRNEPPHTRARSAASLNRDMAVLRAALNKVLVPGKPNTEADWQSALKAVPHADKRRDLYLNRDERRALLNALSEADRPFFTALCLLPLRPGAMARLKVENYNRYSGELTIENDKNGKPRKFVVPSLVGSLLKNQMHNKLPTAALFMRSNGKSWNKDSWKVPIADAAYACGLPRATCAYTLRHSVITDLVGSGLPLLTVAQISDTSVAMIEQHYGHLVSDAAVSALEKLEL